MVKKIAKMAGEDTAARLKKELKQYSLEGKEREELRQAIERSAAKVVAKLCYGLREDMAPEGFRLCLEGLLRSAEELE